MSEEQKRPNLLTVVPGSINIENFVPGRVYKETLMIYNTYKVPIVLNLKSSDSNKLVISESKLRIGVNQSKKLDLIIQDKLNYKYIKNPIKHKKLFIHMKGELIDEKYEINLFYYNKNKKNISEQNNSNLPNLIYNQRIDNPNKYMIINPYNELYQNYLMDNQNNYLNNENINDNRVKQPEYNYPQNNAFQSNNNYLNLNKERPLYMQIGQNDSDEIVNFKNIINDLTNKIMILKTLLDQNRMNKIKKNVFGVTHNSLYIFGNNCEKEIKNKYSLNDNIEIEKIVSRNKILELENSTLLYRIKCLEQKLFPKSNHTEINEGINNNLENSTNNDEEINRKKLRENFKLQIDNKKIDLNSQINWNKMSYYNNYAKEEDDPNNINNYENNEIDSENENYNNNNIEKDFDSFSKEFK